MLLVLELVSHIVQNVLSVAEGFQQRYGGILNSGPSWCIHLDDVCLAERTPA